MATTWRPRRIRSEDERGSGSSQYISLSEGEKFLGYALFEGDPSLNDPAYYEYAEHWYAGAGGKGSSVPCAGDDCPLCEDGDRPRTRAKTLWLVTQDEKGSKLDPPQLRIFNFNYNIIKAVTEMRAEQEKIKGRSFRVSRLDDRGNYTLMPKADTLKATEVKEALKDPQAPDFDNMVTQQLRKAMEGMAITKAIEDPEEDEEPKGKSAAKSNGKTSVGKSKAKDWPAEIEDQIVTVVEVDDDANYFVATAEGYTGQKNIYTTDQITFDLNDLSEDDLVTVSATQDDDGDFILSAEPDTDGVGDSTDTEDEEEKTEGDLPDAIEATEFTIKAVNANESTIDVENEDLNFTLYFLDQGPASEVDFDDYEVGQVIIVSAEKDSQEDMVATEVPKAKKVGAKKATGRKAATTKGK